MTSKKHSAVINTDGTGYRELPNVSANDGCRTWSWDNRYILLCGYSTDGKSRLSKVSIADGQTSELVSLKTGSVARAVFSPDGLHIAYEVTPASLDLTSRIFVLGVGGGEPQQVYEERSTTGPSPSSGELKLLDWTVDGHFLAIASARTGIGALHLLPIREGHSAGVPIFVRYGDFEEGVTWARGGSKIIVTLSKQLDYELWSLENFVPAVPKR